MAFYGELIQALGVLKNVKEKRHAIKTLSSLCANPQYQVRIVQRGGWKTAILPLIISLDEECRKYAALAIANLSFKQETHAQLLDEEVLKHLVPILYSEECVEVVIYVLNAIGNFTSSRDMWPATQHMNTGEAVVRCLRNAEREELKLNCLFCLANMTEDPQQRAWMMESGTYELIWEFLSSPSLTIMEHALAAIRGLSAESTAQDLFCRMQIIPTLLGIFQGNTPSHHQAFALDILHHISFLASNGPIMMEEKVVQCICDCARCGRIEFIAITISLIANLCEVHALHDQIMEGDAPLFAVLSEHILNEKPDVRTHVYRAMMQLSLSPRYHHVILATGAVANACPIAMMERMPIEVRVNVLQMMGTVCATHPTTPTEEDVMDILHLVGRTTHHIEIRRAAAMVFANASAESANMEKLLAKDYIRLLVVTMAQTADVVLTDYLMQFFHNICKLDKRAGAMLVEADYHKYMFTYERLESLSVPASVYLCDTCRQIADDMAVREYLVNEQLFATLMEAWVSYIHNPKLGPHLALMCSAFTFHADAHQEFVLQGGVRLVIDLYQGSQVEHVRLCCILCLLYLAETEEARKAIVQERGLQTLIHACENESHADLISNALKALIPFASSDDYQPQLGMEGAIDTFGGFLFSESVEIKRLAVFLLQNMLELKANRLILLGLMEEKQCEQDYVEQLIKFLPIVSLANQKKSRRKAKAKGKAGAKSPKAEGQEVKLTPHDTFILRCTIHCIGLLSLEHNSHVHAKFIDLNLPQLLFDLYYCEQIDKSAGEAIVLFFANALHGTLEVQNGFLRSCSLISMFLSCKEMGFAEHTNVRCLSALLCIARHDNHRRSVLAHIEDIMASVNCNFNEEERGESFYSCAALHCGLLCELARAPADVHEHLAKVGVIEAFLVFVTIAGRGLRDELCIELLMSAVFGISTLVASPTCGMLFMRNLIYPATRLQLFMSLLRLPQDDINTTFHAGTFGIRTLQQAINPDLEAGELHIDHINMDHFYDQCHVMPATFIYRHIIRTLCLLLADPETRNRVKDSISPQNVVPTCLFALRGCKDPYVRVYGYILVSNFSFEQALVPAFVSDSTIVNEVLDCCRSAALLAAGQETEEDAVVKQLTAIAKGPQWSPKEVSLKMLMLAMTMIANISERIKEKYRAGTHETSAEEDAERNMDETAGLKWSNKSFMKRLAAICIRDLDCVQMMSQPTITDAQEYLSLLRIVISHNSFMTRIELDGRRKGGLVPPFDIRDERKKRPSDNDRVLVELRSEFKGLRFMQKKTDEMIEFVDRLIEVSGSKRLVVSTMECLGALTYLSPLSISSPYKVYELMDHCPEWLQSHLCLLLTNSLADGKLCDPDLDDWKDKGAMLEAASDHLFPLISTSSLETRHYMLGALANLSAQGDMFIFVKNSGVFRILRPLPSRGYFAENFAILLEAVRMLANISSNPTTHKDVATEPSVGFLRDVLKHVVALLHSGATGMSSEPQTVYSRVDVEFDEDDMNPLGLRIRWKQPPQLIEVLPDTPAARLGENLQENDELMEVNGVDVSEMERTDIAPMFNTRPLHLLWRRKVKTEVSPQAKPEIETKLEVQSIEKVGFYGDREQYIECFHLCLLTIHNLATTHTTHAKMLAEPRILNLLMELINSEVVVPSLRRLIFATLTCFAQRRDIAGRIFYQMSDYFMGCEHADTSLQKYIMLCANLFYTSMGSDEVKPDRSMLVFVGRLSDMQGQGEANQLLVEILHGMSRAPKEIRGPFVCRETLVLTVQFLVLRDQWDVQLRAFEAAFLLTNGTCDPYLWAVVDLVPIMVRAAGGVSALVGRVSDDELDGVTNVERADAIWELTMRVVDMCLQYEDLVNGFNNLPELDRYLTELFGSAVGKPPLLMQCAAHLMSALLRSKIGGSCWQRWKTLGIVEKLVVWFKDFRSMLDSKDSNFRKRRDDSEGAGGSKDLDQVFNMLLFAIKSDASLVSTLLAEDVVRVVATRVMDNVTFFRTMQQADDTNHVAVEDTDRAYTSFRTIAQFFTALTASADGLAALSKLELETPLVSLLELPPADYRVPTLLMLCTLCTDKATPSKLMHSKGYVELLKSIALALDAPGSPYPADELEYVACIMDRCCCFSDVCKLVQENVLGLVCLIMSKAETAIAQLLSVRALTRCGFVNPKCLALVPEKSFAAVQFVMALCYCVRGEGAGESGVVEVRKRMKSMALEMKVSHPHMFKLAQHFARAIMCEGLSVSREFSRAVFHDLDGFSMLDHLAQEFEEAYERTTTGGEHQNVVCAELLNGLGALFQTVLCSIFQQGTPGGVDNLFEGEGKTTTIALDAVELLRQVFESIHDLLMLGVEVLDRGEKKMAIASVLSSDIRTLYLLTGILHEVCAKDLRSAFLGAVRTRSYYKCLEAGIRLARKRFEQEVQGPPPKDLFAKASKALGQFTSPMETFLDGYSLPHVFEHLLSCMRHLLVQSMYVPVPAVDPRTEPWVWETQAQLRVHSEALTWLPDILHRYKESHPFLLTETIRYVCAVANFYVAPEAPRSVRAGLLFARHPSGLVVSPGGAGVPSFASTSPTGGTGNADLYVGDRHDVPTEQPTLYPFMRTFTLKEPRLLQILLSGLEDIDDTCTRVLSLLAVVNLADYERQNGVAAETRARDMKVEGLVTLVPVVAKTMKVVKSFPEPLAIAAMSYGVRFFITCLAFGSQPLAVEIFGGETWSVVTLLFEQFFRDELYVEDEAEYVTNLKQMITFARNWICSSCAMEAHNQQVRDARSAVSSGQVPPGMVEDAVQRAAKEARQDRDAETFNQALEPVRLLNFLSAAVLKLTGSDREIANVREIKDFVYEDVIVCYQTLFKRQEARGRINWNSLKSDQFETLLIEIHEHRRLSLTERDDEKLINTLYLITKLDYLYTRSHFPDFLMEVAYGPRTGGHTALQDIAAICCAIIFTQSSKGKASVPTCNLSEVVKDYGDFVTSMAEVPDPRMQLWHFRTITQWSQRPKVIDEVSRVPEALRFIVGALLSDILGRYAVVFVHNISCLRCWTLVREAGALSKLCAAYRGMVPGSQKQGDNTERRHLRRLCLASIRNCMYGVQDLNTDLRDEDLVAIVQIVDAIEEPDIPLYLAALMTICERVSHDRAAAIIPQHGPLVTLCIRLVQEHADSVSVNQPSFLHDLTDLYDYELGEEEDDVAENLGTPTSSPNEQAMQRSSRRLSTGNKKSFLKKKAQQSPTMGLGKRVSLYRRARMSRAARANASAAVARATAEGMDPEEAKKQAAALAGKAVQSSEYERRNAVKEYMYFAAIEILTHTTFKEDQDGMYEAVDAAFEQYPLKKWFSNLQKQAELSNKKDLNLSDFYVQMSAKLIWHGWSNNIFRPHFELMPNLEAVAKLVSYFLEWPNTDVHQLINQVCLFAKLHRQPTVCDYLVKAATKYPELACSLLSSALVDTDAILKPYQAARYMHVFLALLEDNLCSQTGLRRMVLGLETALLVDHPKGLAAYLLERESQMLNDLLEQLSGHCETSFVKQSIAVTLVKTAGDHYKGMPQLDEFAIRVLDLAPGLLESEFTLFLPVLHRLCTVGGKRVQGPVLGRRLHHRIARLLEQSVSELEASRVASPRDQSLGGASGRPEQAAQLGPRQRIQWCLGIFAVLASNELEVQNEADEAAAHPSSQVTTHAPNTHLDSFVCVDLLPILVRILRAQPESFEACSVLFLVSAMSKSPCIAPHMPDMLKHAERAFLPRIEHPDVDHDARSRKASAEALGQEVVNQKTWDHMKLPDSDRVALGMQRSFIHLLGNAGYMPQQSPALIRSPICFRFLRSCADDPLLFEDPCAPLHCKLLALAHMCTREPDHKELLNYQLLDILLESQKQLSEEASQQPRDLRVVWLHAIVSLAKLSGPRLLSLPKAIRLFTASFGYAEAVMQDSLSLGSARGVALALETFQALAMAMCPLSLYGDFESELRAEYAMFLLCLISSGQLASLRMIACECLAKTMSEGHNPDVCGAVLLATASTEALKQLIGGPMDTLAASASKVMMAFVQHAGYKTHMHLLQNLKGVLSMLGDASASTLRILWLAELFVTMTKDRTPEVVDALIDQDTIVPFLSLARSNMASRRDLAQRWLESYGSSLYEIDEVSEVFQKSTLLGLLFVASRCALDPEEAFELRRTIFALVKRRVDTWRNSLYGVGGFFNEDLINVFVPMCELQPDLIAAVVAMFHEFLTRGELAVLDQVYTGGHFPWLCKRMSHKSGAQMTAVRSSGMTVAVLGKHWERHADLVCTQAMALRLLWHFFDVHSVDFVSTAVRKECIVKNWKEFLTYYFQLPWPMRESREVLVGTDAAIALAVFLAKRFAMDANPEMLRKICQQGMLAMCFAVLLPNPQDQKQHRADMKDDVRAADDDLMDPEDALLPDSKLMAGAIVARLMVIPDSFRWMQERRVAAICVAMYAQLHHWREHLFVHKGSIAALPTVTLMERQATLYMALLWVLNSEWCLEHMGLSSMATLSVLFLEIWGRHSNMTMRHYAMRMVTSLCQVQPLYANIMADDERARLVQQAIHQSFGDWDVRALRQIVKFLCSSLAYALQVPVMPETTEISIARALAKPDGRALNDFMKDGGAHRANYMAAAYILRPRFLAEVITQCEHPNGDREAQGDTFGRVWALWLVFTILVNKESTQPDPGADVKDPESLLDFKKQVDPKHLERRRKLLEAQQAVAIGGTSSGSIVSGDEAATPNCRIGWLRDNQQLSGIMSQIATVCITTKWKESMVVGCAATSRCLFELPHFLYSGVFKMDGASILKCLGMPEKPLNFASLQLIAVISSYNLPLRAQTVGDMFLRHFHDLQQEVIEGIVNCGEGPYDLLARWLHAPPGSLPCDEYYRCLISFMIGQCVCPPLAEAPSLKRHGGQNAKRGAPSAIAIMPAAGGDSAPDPPPVAKCPPPPKALLDALASLSLQEDMRLRQAQVRDADGHARGPIYSITLCHLLYAMAVVVPLHAKAAATSPGVRGAAFSQLMKVQQVVAQGVPPHKLYDASDGKRAKVFLFVRATSCIRAALQCITGSWLVAEPGSRFDISDEGGREFVQYCAKHLNQAYNGKTAYTRVLGTPWERMMLGQGPTETIAELLLKVCSSDANLAELSRLGGDQALHSLSRYGESSTVRQQATMLLTKLAVLNA